MGRLVEFDLNNGGTILVEVHETTSTGGPVTRDLRGDQVTERARRTFEDAVERIEPPPRRSSRGSAVWRRPRRSAGRVRPGPTRRSRRFYRSCQRNCQLQNRHDLAAPEPSSADA